MKPHDGEVAEIFEVPLPFLCDPANHFRRIAEFKGRTAVFYEVPYDRHRIWGATAGMVINLAHVLGAVTA